MRAFLPAYEMKSASSLSEALELLGRGPGTWKPFAGGTDLMVLLEAGKLEHWKFVNIWKLKELRGIEERAGEVLIGALTTYTEIQSNATLQEKFPLLCQAAAETGGVATQNRGTLGGNIVNASPAADSPPALLVYEADLELVSARGLRWVPYQAFHTGYKQMLLRPEELVRRIRLRRENSPSVQYYRKVGTRRAQAISKVCFAGVASIEGGEIRDARIALGSVAPTVVRCQRTEAILNGQRPDQRTVRVAREELGKEISPIDDMRSTARYRLHVAQNLLGEFLQHCEMEGRSAGPA